MKSGMRSAMRIADSGFYRKGNPFLRGKKLFKGRGYFSVTKYSWKREKSLLTTYWSESTL